MGTIRIPAEIGRLQEIHAGIALETVILIQDTHSIPEAQLNIQRLIAHFQEAHGSNLIAVEGAASKYDPLIFRSFPDLKHLRKTFMEYMEQGELTGPAAAAILNEIPAEYQGVEDWELYEEGLRFYLKALARESAVLKNLQKEAEDIEKRKKAVYSAPLLAVDKVLTSFGENKTDVLQALKTLSETRAPDPGSELALFLGAGKEVDPAKAEQEVKRLAAAFRADISKGRFPALAASGFHEKYQEFQTSRITVDAFALFLEEFRGRVCAEDSAPASCSSETSSGLAERVHNQRRMSDIQGTEFSRQFDLYTAAVKDSLFRSEEEKALDSESGFLLLLQRFARLELTPEDWRELRAAKPNEKWLPVLSVLDEHRAFYENAENRDDVFFKKLLLLMESRKSRTVLFVAGGFHTEGLVSRLRERGLSYALVTPAISSLPETTSYRGQMNGEVSWKEYFHIENGKVDLYKAFVRGARTRLLPPEGQAGVLKLWRDQILRNLAETDALEDARSYTVFLDEIAQDDAPAWAVQAEAFAGGLEQLRQVSQVSRENILTLLKSRAAVPEALSAAIQPGALSEIFSSPEIFSVTARSEMRGEDGEQALPLADTVYGRGAKVLRDLLQTKGESDRVFEDLLVRTGFNPDDPINSLERFRKALLEHRVLSDTPSEELQAVEGRFAEKGLKYISPAPHIELLNSYENIVESYVRGLALPDTVPKNFSDHLRFSLETLYDFYLFDQLSMLAVELWDNTTLSDLPDQEIYAVIVDLHLIHSRLTRSASEKRQRNRFTRNLASLFFFGVSKFINKNESLYLRQEEKLKPVFEALKRVNTEYGRRFEMDYYKTAAARQGRHLKSILLTYLKEEEDTPVEERLNSQRSNIDDNFMDADLAGVDNRNEIDFARLVIQLTRLFELYEEYGKFKPVRLEIAEGIAGGLSYPITLVNRDRLVAILKQGNEKHNWGIDNVETYFRIDYFFSLLTRNAKQLDEDFNEVTSYDFIPHGVSSIFAHKYLEVSALQAMLTGKPVYFAFEDSLFTPSASLFLIGPNDESLRSSGFMELLNAHLASLEALDREKKMDRTQYSSRRGFFFVQYVVRTLRLLAQISPDAASLQLKPPAVFPQDGETGSAQRSELRVLSSEVVQVFYSGNTDGVTLNNMASKIETSVFSGDVNEFAEDIRLDVRERLNAVNRSARGPVSVTPDLAEKATRWLTGVLTRKTNKSLGIIVDAPENRDSLQQALLRKDVSEKIGVAFVTRRMRDIKLDGINVETIGTASGYRIRHSLDNGRAMPAITDAAKVTSEHVFSVRLSGEERKSEPFFSVVAEVARVVTGLLTADKILPADELKKSVSRSDIKAELLKDLFQDFAGFTEQDGLIQFDEDGNLSVNQSILFRFVTEHLARERVTASA